MYQNKMCLLAHLVRASAGPDSLPLFLSETKLPKGFAWEPVWGLWLHGERGGGFSLVFAEVLLSLISLIPKSVKTAWAKIRRFQRFELKVLILTVIFFPPVLFADTGLQCWLLSYCPVLTAQTLHYIRGEGNNLYVLYLCIFLCYRVNEVWDFFFLICIIGQNFKVLQMTTNLVLIWSIEL